MKRFAWLGLLLVPDAAVAQDGTPLSFKGVFAGPEVGLQAHGFNLRIAEPASGVVLVDRAYNRTGVAGGGFVGFDLAATRRLRLGVEAGATVGGGEGGSADLPGGSRFELRPRWGYRVMGRAGYMLGDRTLAYAQAGYGALRYRLRTGTYIDDAREWERGMAYGVGIERRLGRAAIRLDYRRIAGYSDQLSLGMPFRL